MELESFDRPNGYWKQPKQHCTANIHRWIDGQLTSKCVHCGIVREWRRRVKDEFTDMTPTDLRELLRSRSGPSKG